MKFDPNGEGQKILQYYFNNKKMNAHPLSERLVIKPKFSNIGNIMVHESIVKIFKKHNLDTLNFVKVSEWKMGKQFVE